VTPSEQLSRAVIEACLQRGVAEFAVCPGSRDSPLILEILRSGLPARPFFDERAAGFFALGRAIALRRPVAVVTTSGTAVAELYPAVIEALYQRVPLLCVTADRPASFRGSGAPQSIEQRGLFCLYATDSWDVRSGPVDLSGWEGYGPAHLNVCLADPLLSPGGGAVGGPLLVPDLGKPKRHRSKTKFQMPRPDLIFLGAIPPQDRNRIRARLVEWGCPILADAMSGLREDPLLQSFMIRGGERSLRDHPLQVVLRIGSVPTFRLWRDMETLPGVSVWSVECHGFRGLGRDCCVLPSFDGLSFAPGPPADFPREDSRVHQRIEAALAAHPSSEPGLFRALARQIPAGAGVFLGNSLPVREWNLAAPYEAKDHLIWANRGANGIDGNLATFLGWGVDQAESWGIFGDLTTLYDMNAPWILPHLPPGKRRIVVVNNEGGRIFARLPGLAQVPESFKAFTESRHRLRFRSWAEFWGLDYVEWTGGSLPTLPDHVVIEALPGNSATEAFWEALDTP